MKFLKFLLASAFSVASAFAAAPVILHEDTVSDMVAGAAPTPGDICIAAGRDAIGDGAGGIFIGQTTTLSTNLGTIFAKTNADAVKWRRQYDGPVKARWFGAVADDTISDTPNIASMIRYVGTSGDKHILFDAGQYDIGENGRMSIKSAFTFGSTNFNGLRLEGVLGSTVFRHADASTTLFHFLYSKFFGTVADNVLPDIHLKNLTLDDHSPWQDLGRVATCKYLSKGNVSLAAIKNNATMTRELTSPALATAQVTLKTGDRIILKDQTNPAENGIYVVGAASTSRDPNWDSTAEWGTGWQAFYIDDKSQFGRYQWTPTGAFALNTDPATVTPCVLRNSVVALGTVGTGYRAKQLSFENVRFVNCSEHYLSLSASGTDIVFKECVIEGNDVSGKVEEIYFAQAAEVLFDECLFKGPNSVKFIYAARYGSMTIIGCVFDKAYQIGSFRGGKLVFVGNTIKGGDTPGSFADRTAWDSAGRAGSLIEMNDLYRIGPRAVVISDNIVHGFLGQSFVEITDCFGIDVVNNVMTAGANAFVNHSSFEFVMLRRNCKEVYLDGNYVEMPDGGSGPSPFLSVGPTCSEIRIGDNRIKSGTLSAGRNSFLPFTGTPTLANGTIIMEGTLDGTGSYSGATSYNVYWAGGANAMTDGSTPVIDFSAGGSVVLRDGTGKVQHVSGNWTSDDAPVRNLSIGSLLTTPATGRIQLSTAAGLREVLESSRGIGSATSQADLAANFNPKKFSSVATASDNRLWYSRLASGGYNVARENVVASSDATYVWTTDPLKRTTDNLDSLTNSPLASFSSTNVWVADENKTFQHISPVIVTNTIAPAGWDELVGVTATPVTGGVRYTATAANAYIRHNGITGSAGKRYTMTWTAKVSKPGLAWFVTTLWKNPVWNTPKTVNATTPTQYSVTFTPGGGVPDKSFEIGFYGAASGAAAGDWFEIYGDVQIGLLTLPKTPDGNTIFQAADNGVWEAEDPPTAAWTVVGNAPVTIPAFDSPSISSINVTTVGVVTNRQVSVTFAPPLPPGVLFEAQPLSSTSTRIDLLNMSGDRVAISSNATVQQ